MRPDVFFTHRIGFSVKVSNRNETVVTVKASAMDETKILPFVLGERIRLADTKRSLELLYQNKEYARISSLGSKHFAVNVPSPDR